MTATYTINVDEEFSPDIFQSIKQAFKGKTIDIVVSESVESRDETEYLLSSPANRESLMRSMKQIEEGNTVSFSIEEFKEKYGQK